MPFSHLGMAISTCAVVHACIRRRVRVVRRALVCATRLAARSSDSKVPASVHQPSRNEKRHRAFADVGVVDVGDFEFVAAGGFAGVDLVEDRRVIHIDAGDGVIRFRVRGFFLDADDAVAVELGDAEALGVGDFFEEDAGAFALCAEGIDGAADVLLDDVVAEDDADFLPSAKCSQRLSASAMPPSPS